VCGLLCVSLVFLCPGFLPWGRALKGIKTISSGCMPARSWQERPSFFLRRGLPHGCKPRRANIWLPSVLHSRPPFLCAAAQGRWAVLPYRAAYSVFEGLNLAALAIFLLRFPGEMLLFGPWASRRIPVITAFGQRAGRAAGSAGRGRFPRRIASRPSILAGLLLALCSVKFHMFALSYPVVLGAAKTMADAGGRRRRRCGLFMLPAHSPRDGRGLFPIFISS